MFPSRAAERLFAAFLRLYPPAFRESFDPEIRDVFSESVRQAGRRGFLPALAVVLREIGDLPINLLAEYWEEYHMQTLQMSQPIVRPVWWGAVGFGLSAALINVLNTLFYLRPSESTAGFSENWFFWIEFLGYAVVGGLGGLLFALVCKQLSKARLYFMAGSLGFLIGHLIWYGVMLGFSILMFYVRWMDDSAAVAMAVLRWTDLILMLAATGLAIGWLSRSGGLAARLAGSGALGAGIGLLIGAAFCGVLLLIGISAVGKVVMITSVTFVVSSISAILGGALLGRAIGRESGARAAPAASQ